MLCKYCGLDKNEDDFEDANIINGRVYKRRKCRSCKIVRQNERRKEIRQWLDNYKSNLHCEICGFSDSRALTFHHLDKLTKDFAISEMPGYSIKSIQREISKCQVLCANCHTILHFNEQRMGLA